MEKKDYNDNYSRVRHSNAEQDNAFLSIYAWQRAFGW